MGSAGEIRPSVLLLDNYGEESRMLHESLRKAGFTGPVLVMNDDAFLPDDVISVYGYFCGAYETGEGIPGRPRYFNQINVPDYWEISGTNSGGSIHDMSHERGRIYYTEPKNRRLVKVVDWMDEKGTVRSCDHYNRYGALWARTTFNKKGQKFCRAYFDGKGREVLTENFVTGDILLNRDGKTLLFRNRTQLARQVLKEIAPENSRILFNSLSYPFFVSNLRTFDEKCDILFWQEGPRDDIPGNMQMIFDGRAGAAKEVYVQNRQSYEKLLQLGAPGELVHPLGFIYPFERENTGRNSILICTNSDQIEKLTELVEALPEMHFYIAAITEMSSKLLGMEKYTNVSLFPNVRMGRLKELYVLSDYYLDINHGDEIVSAVKRAFLNNQLIVGFADTLHNRSYITPDHIFRDEKAMISFIRRVIADRSLQQEELSGQRLFAMAEEPEAYKKLNS